MKNVLLNKQSLLVLCSSGSSTRNTVFAGRKLCTSHWQEHRLPNGARLVKKLRKIHLEKIYPLAIRFRENIPQSGFTSSAKTEQIPAINMSKTDHIPISTEKKPQG